jgi:hypothetical protein
MAATQEQTTNGISKDDGAKPEVRPDAKIDRLPGLPTRHPNK